MVDPRGYRAGTRAALALLSQGQCYFPGCKVPVIVFVDGEPIINYQIAHIQDARPGNRYVEQMTDDERRSFKNLVLLCQAHHTEVDKVHPGTYSSETLGRWKAEREGGVVAQLRGLDGLTEDRLAGMIREALADRQAGDAGRSISDDTATRMRNLLQRYAGQRVGLASFAGDVEASAFKRSLAGVLVSSGWEPVDKGEFMFFGSRTGICITIPFEANEQALWLQALTSACMEAGQPVMGNRGDMANDCFAYVQVWPAGRS